MIKSNTTSLFCLRIKIKGDINLEMFVDPDWTFEQLFYLLEVELNARDDLTLYKNHKIYNSLEAKLIDYIGSTFDIYHSMKSIFYRCKIAKIQPLREELTLPFVIDAHN